MPITTEKWIRRINKLAIDMDETENSTHPSVWPELLANEIAEFKRLCALPTADHAIQLRMEFDSREKEK